VEEQVSKKLVFVAPLWLYDKVVKDMILCGEVQPLTLQEKNDLEIDLLKQIFEQR